MKSRFVIRWILALLLFCSPSLAEPDYYPLSEGSWWCYRVSDPSGVSLTKRKLESVTDQNDGTWDMDFIQETNGVVSKLWYILHETGFRLQSVHYPGSERSLVYTPGYFQLGFCYSLYDPEEHRYKRFEPGEVYHYEGRVEEKPGGASSMIRETHLVKKVEKVRTPAGTFEALRVDTSESADGPVIRTTWYAKNVGIVKSVSGDKTEVLTSYSIKPYPDYGD